MGLMMLQIHGPVGGTNDIEKNYITLIFTSILTKIGFGINFEIRTHAVMGKLLLYCNLLNYRAKFVVNLFTSGFPFYK
jgi:hypothetical protein